MPWVCITFYVQINDVVNVHRSDNAVCGHSLNYLGKTYL